MHPCDRQREFEDEDIGRESSRLDLVKEKKGLNEWQFYGCENAPTDST